ncbi:MAG: hypothetical protein IJY36_04965 [Coprobacter sp.]|nr:hypothetical protein [Coprobacter sp.]
MIKIFLAALLAIIAYTQTFAQDIREQKARIERIKHDDAYYWGEAVGANPGTAKKTALDELVESISMNVVSDFIGTTHNVVHGENADTKQEYKSVVRTYSSAVLNGVKSIKYDVERGVYIFAYITKSAVDTIFELRKTKVYDMMRSAQNALADRRINDALRNYYWAYSLLQTLPRPNEVYYTVGTTPRVLTSWLPEHIRSIFAKIRVVPELVEKNSYNLYITYDGKPISSLEYRYHNGTETSDLHVAKDGRGNAEFIPGYSPRDWKIECEYEFAESMTDNEVKMATEAMAGYYFPEAKIKVDAVKTEGKSASGSTLFADVATAQKATAAHLENLQMVEAEYDRYDEQITRIIDAVSQRDYTSVQDCFTTEGWAMFDRLIAYGNARLYGTNITYSFYRAKDKVVCRSVPMSFAFRNNKKFVEDVTFTFDRSGKIEAVAFALGYEALSDIWKHVEWNEYSRFFLATFLENYKTAYALERLEYLEGIFDDNAVIITGTVRPTPIYDKDINTYTEHLLVKRTRQSKHQYMRNLEACFNANEYVNIRFADNLISRADNGGELYGIQIKQDYYSTHYSDKGYLFLYVDLNNSDKPIIKVRTWQVEKDPTLGVYTMYNF